MRLSSRTRGATVSQSSASIYVHPAELIANRRVKINVMWLRRCLSLVRERGSELCGAREALTDPRLDSHHFHRVSRTFRANSYTVPDTAVRVWDIVNDMYVCVYVFVWVICSAVPWPFLTSSKRSDTFFCVLPDLTLWRICSSVIGVKFV